MLRQAVCVCSKEMRWHASNKIEWLKSLSVHLRCRYVACVVVSLSTFRHQSWECSTCKRSLCVSVCLLKSHTLPQQCTFLLFTVIPKLDRAQIVMEVFFSSMGRLFGLVCIDIFGSIAFVALVGMLHGHVAFCSSAYNIMKWYVSLNCSGVSFAYYYCRPISNRPQMSPFQQQRSGTHGWDNRKFGSLPVARCGLS